MFYAARLLERGYTIDATYESAEACDSDMWIMYSELGCAYRPVQELEAK